VSHLWREILCFVDRMGPQQWLLVLAAMIVVAAICMRGYGSRSQY
jgi:hypothetical protein